MKGKFVPVLYLLVAVLEAVWSFHCCLNCHSKNGQGSKALSVIGSSLTSKKAMWCGWSRKFLTQHHVVHSDTASSKVSKLWALLEAQCT